jgi:hypothetical protein
VSRKEFDASRMRRIKRLAARHGLTILTDEKMKVQGHAGGHAIRNEDYQVIFGNMPKPFSATLDDVEAYIDKLEAGEE